MQIVKAKPPKSKAKEIREICKDLCNQDKAVHIELESERRYFDKIARADGYKIKSRITKDGGWLIWITVG